MTVTWQQALKNPDFWCWYWLVDGWRERMDIPMPSDALYLRSGSGGTALVLEVSKYERTLYLEHPRLKEKTQLGWLDEVQWHPDALRWAETERIAQAQPRGEKTLPRPGEALLLLAVFTPLTRTDEHARVKQLLDEAAVRAGVPAGVRGQLEAYASSPQAAEWKRVARRWVLEGAAHSLRHADNPSFPFHELQELEAG